jgi:hypothetical protein
MSGGSIAQLFLDTLPDIHHSPIVLFTEYNFHSKYSQISHSKVAIF